MKFILNKVRLNLSGKSNFFTVRPFLPPNCAFLLDFYSLEMRFTRILMNIGLKYKNARALLDVEVGATKKEIHSPGLEILLK